MAMAMAFFGPCFNTLARGVAAYPPGVSKGSDRQGFEPEQRLPGLGQGMDGGKDVYAGVREQQRHHNGGNARHVGHRVIAMRLALFLLVS